MWSTEHCVIVVCILFGVVLAADSVDPIVQIADGRLKGVEAVTDANNITFWAFLGIPYAAPPIGSYRFKVPRPVTPWTNIRDANYERSTCIQGFNPVTGSEDCLFINVFTTNLLRNNSVLLPVMVFIHGGGFTTGSGNIGIHGANRFLDHGVILVTMNYRLGIFGFLCTEDAASPGNYGLKDQIAALKWVQTNIVKFGGDSASVTIFGQSAGAASVHYLLQSKLTEGLYHAAISESGSTLDSWAISRNPRQLATKVGLLHLIITNNSTTLVDGLSRVNASKLQSSTAAPALLYTLDFWNGLPWSPSAENDLDGAVVTSYSYELLKYGDFVQVPVLVGFNSNEARDTSSIQWLGILYSLQFDLVPETLVPKDMNAVDKKAASNKIRALYFKNQTIYNNTNFIHYASDSLFVRGIRKTAILMSKYVTTYLYLFSFTGGVTHKSFQPEGVSHAEELQFLFNSPSYVQVSVAAKLTQERMLKLWTNFAKTGNPTVDPTDPVLGATWQRVDVTQDSDIEYLDIGAELVPRLNPESTEMTFWDNLYRTYGFEPYSTY